jgi:hypothetical protein
VTDNAISNHGNYLLVNGGMNASCAAPATHYADHCGPRATRRDRHRPRRGRADMFAGITSLPERATFCQARKATEAKCCGTVRLIVLGTCVDDGRMGRGWRAHRLLSTNPDSAPSCIYCRPSRHGPGPDQSPAAAQFKPWPRARAVHPPPRHGSLGRTARQRVRRHPTLSA